MIVEDEAATGVMYDALGFTVRELGIALDILNSIAAGLALADLYGALVEINSRVDRVHSVAAELRGRYA